VNRAAGKLFATMSFQLDSDRPENNGGQKRESRCHGQPVDTKREAHRILLDRGPMPER
jgi:hypothetical protein